MSFLSKNKVKMPKSQKHLPRIIQTHNHIQPQDFCVFCGEINCDEAVTLRMTWFNEDDARYEYHRSCLATQNFADEHIAARGIRDAGLKFYRAQKKARELRMVQLRNQYRHLTKNLDDVKTYLEIMLNNKKNKRINKRQESAISAIKRKYPDLYNEVEKWTSHE